MSRRRSIHIDGFGHKNPIPNASVIGNMLVTGVIMGRDTRSETVPDAIEAQCAVMFERRMDSNVSRPREPPRPPCISAGRRVARNDPVRFHGSAGRLIPRDGAVL
jgi:hypothetical protein